MRIPGAGRHSSGGVPLAAVFASLIGGGPSAVIEPMIDRSFAETFAAEWIAAWNAHDLDRILSHYAEDFRFSSPFIPEVTGEPSGTLQGRAAVRAYWAKALSRRPDLHFELVSVLAGIGSIVIVYSRHDGRLGAELFEFGIDGQVVRSAAHYAGQ